MLSASYDALSNGLSHWESQWSQWPLRSSDACDFFNRHRDKRVVTISAQGTNEDTHEKLSRLSSSSLEASFASPWIRPELVHP